VGLKRSQSCPHHNSMYTLQLLWAQGIHWRPGNNILPRALAAEAWSASRSRGARQKNLSKLVAEPLWDIFALRMPRNSWGRI
jgi:hypothetical protein